MAVASVRRADLTREDVEAIQYVLENGTFWDMGPLHAGWPSAEMQKALGRLRSLVDRTSDKEGIR